MSSLSSFDVGKKTFEGRRYRNDIEAAHEGMETLLGPIKEYNSKCVEQSMLLMYPSLSCYTGITRNESYEQLTEIQNLMAQSDLMI